ncbi:trace amine-associated receptor 13c-like [Kryptolebias marmoratus]|uniref:trace amine-associated receptor 13c-like n=1 Tax=Kryptolebias marmoratus TaxID=37003 RepID=UPI0007F8D401|nr:trace amine-associated receptor 13c-like [Kryptolebias marmoratus]
MMQIQNGTELCFPHLLNNSCRKPTLHWSEAVFLNIVMSFISLITVALNLLVIISVSHFRHLHTPTNILLLSLGVSDLLVGLLLMPFEIFRNTTCWVLGNIMCVLYCYLITHVVCASVGNIVLISFDRYVAICDPLHYPTRISRNRAKCLVCLCWLWYGIYSILFLKDDVIQPGRSNSCVGECALIINYVIGTIDIILNFVFPVTVIIVLYMRVFVVAVSQARAMRSQITAVTLHHSVNVKTKKSELKAARTLGILILIYFICFCPYFCYSLIEVDLNSTPYVSFLVSLFYFNSCINPVIYALFYPWFRKAVKLIFTLQILKPGSREINIL